MVWAGSSGVWGARNTSRWTPGLGERCGLPRRDRAAGSHADLQLAKRGWPVDPVGGGAKAGERGGGVIGGEPVPVPAVRSRDGPPVGRRAVARRHQRDRPLQRAGAGIDSGEVGEAVAVLGVLVISQRLHRIEVLVGRRAALRCAKLAPIARNSASR